MLGALFVSIKSRTEDRIKLGEVEELFRIEGGVAVNYCVVADWLAMPQGGYARKELRTSCARDTDNRPTYGRYTSE